MREHTPVYESPSSDKFGEGCYDALKYVGEALHEVVPTDMPAWVVGGIAAAPLQPGVGTEMSANSKQLKVQEGSDLSLLRQPTTKNGIVTIRDLDVVVGGRLTLSQERNIKEKLTEAVEGKMPVSLFGFDRAEPWLSPQARRRLNIGSFISRRMLPVDARSVTDADSSLLQLYPFQIDVPREAYDTWQMHLPNGSIIPVMPPITTHMNYFVRSLGGSRSKDQAKLDEMRKELFGYHQPDSVTRKAHRVEFRDALQSDTYCSLGALARTLDRLPREMLLTKKYIRQDVLHPQATAPDVIAAKARAVFLCTGERHEAIVSRVQSDRIQGMLRFFVGQSK